MPPGEIQDNSGKIPGFIHSTLHFLLEFLLNLPWKQSKVTLNYCSIFIVYESTKKTQSGYKQVSYVIEISIYNFPQQINWGGTFGFAINYIF